MKKLFRNLLCATLALSATLSCSDDPGIIRDFVPLVVSVKVLDPQGYSTLNALNTSRISATFRGQTYACHQKEARNVTPDFDGLTYASDYLLFGELDVEQTYSDEQLIIHWGNGSKDDTICFDHRLIWNADTPHSATAFRLNGHEVEHPITIYKDLSLPADTLPADTLPADPAPVDTTRLMYLRNDIRILNSFGFNLFREMLAADVSDKNLVASPLGVASGLGMLLGGSAPGSITERELSTGLLNFGKVLIIDKMDNDPVYPHDALQQIITYAPLADPAVDVRIANGFFFRNDFSIYAGYAHFLAQYYQADYERLNFSSPEGLSRINEWSNQKTKGAIPSFFSALQLDSPASACIASAASFKGGWTCPFDPGQTSDGEFRAADGTRWQQPMMRQVLHTRFAHAEGFDALCLPFANGAYEMMILLPGETATTGQLVQTLAAETDLQQLPWQDGYVHVSLPRFQVSASHSLHQLLPALGVRRVFTPEAELTEVSPDAGLYVSFMVQCAKIGIDEDGCEGGTFAGGRQTSLSSDAQDGPIPETLVAADGVFAVNRPFVWLITERSTGAVLFVGTYVGGATM